MRENKFKVWDTVNNKWFEPVYEAYKGELIELFLSPSGALTLRNMNTFEHCQSIYPDRFKVVFYTGLKDKAGVEIYEGDIFDLGTDKPVAIIEYDYCGFVFKWIDGIFKTIRQFEKEPIFRNVHLFEVIGNIYENPDLINLND